MSDTPQLIAQLNETRQSLDAAEQEKAALVAKVAELTRQHDVTQRDLAAEQAGRIKDRETALAALNAVKSEAATNIAAAEQDRDQARSAMTAVQEQFAAEKVAHAADRQAVDQAHLDLAAAIEARQAAEQAIHDSEGKHALDLAAVNARVAAAEGERDKARADYVTLSARAAPSPDPKLQARVTELEALLADPPATSGVQVVQYVDPDGTVKKRFYRAADGSKHKVLPDALRRQAVLSTMATLGVGEAAAETVIDQRGALQKHFSLVT